jgi:hypothetical protein
MTPADSYHEALNSHRHYDTMANTSLSLIGAAIAGAPALYAAASRIAGSELVFAVCALLIHFAIQTYKRFDRYAAIALNVASAIEKNDARFISPPIGFATVFASIGIYKDLDTKDTSRTYKRIRLIGYSVSITFLLAAMVIAVGRFYGFTL